MRSLLLSRTPRPATGQTNITHESPYSWAASDPAGRMHVVLYAVIHPAGLFRYQAASPASTVVGLLSDWLLRLLRMKNLITSSTSSTARAKPMQISH